MTCHCDRNRRQSRYAWRDKAWCQEWWPCAVCRNGEYTDAVKSGVPIEVRVIEVAPVVSEPVQGRLI